MTSAGPLTFLSHWPVETCSATALAGSAPGPGIESPLSYAASLHSAPAPELSPSLNLSTDENNVNIQCWRIKFYKDKETGDSIKLNENQRKISLEPKDHFEMRTNKKHKKE